MRCFGRRQFGVVVGLLVGLGCAHPVVTLTGQTVTSTGVAASPDSATSVAAAVHAPDYIIGPFDVLDIVFWRDKDLSGEVIVRPDGKISLPLLNEIEAGGLTPEELRGRILQRARRYVEEPTATVIVKQINSRRVFIMGEVVKPGIYPLTGPTTLLQLIATAGGMSEFADTENIVVMRTVAGRPERLRLNYKAILKGKDLAQNVELTAGDTVIVP
jgi:polysaccharide export outer membrane protein